MESASAAACCTSPSSAPRKGHRREPSSATSGEARWGTWIMGFSHLPAGQGQILYLVLNMSCIDDLASQPVSTPLCQKSISTLMTPNVPVSVCWFALIVFPWHAHAEPILGQKCLTPSFEPSLMGRSWPAESFTVFTAMSGLKHVHIRPKASCSN